MPDYVKVGKVSDFSDDGLIHAVEVEGDYVAVVNVGGKLHAFSNTCTHAGFPLSGGAASATEIVCFAHGAVFNIDTGEVLDGPANDSVPV